MNKNSEKGIPLFHKFINLKKELSKTSGKDIPTSLNEIKTIKDGNKYREEIIKELTKKIHDIQNVGMIEINLRAMNDEINKLLKEKSLVEDKIKKLGGPDWKVDAPETYIDGCLKKGDYTYWGAARDLPGVRELYQKEVPIAPVKINKNLYEKITNEYYGDGYNTDEEEKEMELKLRGDPIIEDKFEVERFRSIHFGFSTNLNQEGLDKIILQRKKEVLINKINSK